MQKELKPCPFCGGEVTIEEVAYTNNIEIKCKKCQVSMIKKAFRPSGTTEIDVVKTWNTRKPMEQIEIELEKICYEEYHSCCDIVRLDDAIDILRKGGV